MKGESRSVRVDCPMYILVTYVTARYNYLCTLTYTQLRFLQDFRFEFSSTLRKVRSYRSSLSEARSNNFAFCRLIISLHKNTINVRSSRTNGIFP